MQPGRAGPGRALPPPWAAPLAGRPAERARRTPCSRPGPGRGWRGRRVRVRWPAAAATARRAKRPRRRAGGRHGATPGPCESARHRSRAPRPPPGPGGRAGSGRAAPAAAVGGVGRAGAGRNSVQLRIGPHHPDFTAERRAPKPSRRTNPRRPPTPLARPAPGVRRHRPEAPGTRGGPSCRRAGLLGENRGRFWPIGRDYHENLVRVPSLRTPRPSGRAVRSDREPHHGIARLSTWAAGVDLRWTVTSLPANWPMEQVAAQQPG